MKPFDDSIPEESEAQHLELVTMLQRTHHKLDPLAPTEQEQIIARVRERLLGTDQVEKLSENNSAQQVEAADLTLQAPVGSSKTARPVGRIMRLINTLAAVLVVGAIIGTSLLLFTHHPSSSMPPAGSLAGPVGTPITVHTERGGLEASMGVTPGPYFLSEILAADFSLTNHSHTTYSLAGGAVESRCGTALSVNMTGGNAPDYTPPSVGFFSCPFRMTSFQPGQTIHLRLYFPLTESGRVTLTESAQCLVKVMDHNNGSSITNVPCPLDGHWPSLGINVNSHVPSDRMLSFHRVGSHIFVDAPKGTHIQLLYLYSVICQDYQAQGGTGTGNGVWEPIATNEVSEPGCPGKNVKWTFAFSAVGYAIVSGSYPAP